MSLIVLNLINSSAAAILLFILFALPGKSLNKIFYLKILLVLHLMHLGLSLLLSFGQIGLREYAPLALSMVVAYGPAFYFYIQNRDQKPSGIIWHLAPSILGLWSIFMVARLTPVVIPQWTLTIYYLGILSAYFILSIHEIIHLRKASHFNWIKTCGWWFGCMIAFFIFEGIWINIDLSSLLASTSYTKSIYYLFSLFFVLKAISQVIRQPGWFASIRLSRTYKSTPSIALPSELETLVSQVIDAKKYLDSDLSRDLISRETGISVHRISEIINSHFKMNFNDWINSHRINHAKSLLLEANMSIKETLYRSGFNSKSSFINAFKKHVGCTPSSYQKQGNTDNLVA